jgi:hypothetical protein
MEAIPLSDTLAAACAKALTFTWISCFGVPETITSDRGWQFTSNPWFKLCEMLHISHRQTTAYHPEVNGAIKRLHPASRMPFAHAPRPRLGPRSYLLCSSDSEHSRGKTLVFSRLRQFLALPLCSLMNFCKTKKCQLMLLSKNFQKPCMYLPFLCLGTILAPSCQNELPGDLLSAPLVWVRRGSVILPFSHSKTAPTPSCAAGPAPSPSESGPGTRSSPSAASRLARPRTPRLAARVTAAGCRVLTQVVLLQPSGSRFQTRWFLYFSSGAAMRGPGTVFLPGEEVFARPGPAAPSQVTQTRYHRGWTSDLFSSRPRPELGGSPVDTCVNPWRR